MAKVEARFNLSRALTDHELDQISRVHAVYGILMARVLPSGDELLIEYDASRLSASEVRGILDEHGIPIV